MLRPRGRYSWSCPSSPSSCCETPARLVPYRRPRGKRNPLLRLKEKAREWERAFIVPKMKLSFRKILLCSPLFSLKITLFEDAVEVHVVVSEEPKGISLKNLITKLPRPGSNLCLVELCSRSTEGCWRDKPVFWMEYILLYHWVVIKKYIRREKNRGKYYYGKEKSGLLIFGVGLDSRYPQLQRLESLNALLHLPESEFGSVEQGVLQKIGWVYSR